LTVYFFGFGFAAFFTSVAAGTIGGGIGWG